MSEAVRLTVVPEAVQVAPGEQVSLTLTVEHRGRSGAHYRLDVSGLLADWYTLDRPFLALRRAARAQVLLTVHPPALPVTRAGRYTLTVQVRAAEDPALQAATAVDLTVRTSGGVDMDVQPAEAEGRTGVFHITFLNQLTWPVPVALTAQDAENALRFRITPGNPVVVPATGVAGPVTVHVAPRVRTLLREPHPYEIEFRSLDLDNWQQNEQRARFVYVPRYPADRLPVWLRRTPRWALLLPLILLLLLVVVAGGRALARPAARPAVTPPPAPAPTRPRATAQGFVPIPSISRFTLVHGRRGQPYALVWQIRSAVHATLNGRPVAARGRLVLRAPLHSATHHLVAITGVRRATASLHLVVDGHTSDRHAFVLTTPDIATFAVRRRKGRLEAIWRVHDAVHVWLQGRLVGSTGAAWVPADASWLRLVASNDVGSRQRLLHLAHLMPTATPTVRPTVTPRPRPTATLAPPPTRRPAVRPATMVTPRPTATPIPRPTDTPIPRPTDTPIPRPTDTPTPRPTDTPTARPTATPTPRPTATSTARPTATPTARPIRAPTPAVVPTPRPTATPTPVSITIGSTTPPAAITSTATAVPITCCATQP